MEVNSSHKKGWSIESINEIFRDLFGFEIILEIKRRMKDLEAKNYISLFLSTIAPVVIYEIADSLEKLELVNKTDFFNPGMLDKVRRERMRILKTRIVKSQKLTSISTQMGIDFSEKVYDMNVILSHEKLFDMNFETYVDALLDIDFWNSLFGFPHRTISILLDELGTNYTIDQLYENTVIDNTISEYADIIDAMLRPQKYSYSSYVLFSKSSILEDADKFFILYRFRMISSVLQLEKMLPYFEVNGNGFPAIDTCSFMRKWKAVIIEIIGNELKVLKSKFGDRIKTEIEQKIRDKTFFSLNRKLRNNLHYLKTEKLSSQEIQIIDQYQNEYLRALESIILEQLNVQIDDECKEMTGFLIDCRERGLSAEDVKKYYPFNYLKYRLSRKHRS